MISPSVPSTSMETALARNGFAISCPSKRDHAVPFTGNVGQLDDLGNEYQQGRQSFARKGLRPIDAHCAQAEPP